MSIAEEVDCPDDQCPVTDSETPTGGDDGGDDGGTTVPEKQTYCPFKHTLCLGSDGTVTITENETQYADGNYNQITLLDGCVKGLENIAPRGYVAPACCDRKATDPPANPEVTIAPGTCQLLKDTGLGLSVEIQTKATGDYKITGCGTATDPLCVTGPAVPAGTVITTPCNITDCVTVTGEGTQSQPLKVCHKTAISAGTYGPFTVDKCGHILSYDNNSAGKTYTSTSLAINQQLCTIERATVGTPQTIPFLGGSITLNEFGDITNVTAPNGLSTTVNYTKADGTTGTLTYTDGILTGET